jgi:threonine/homoserine/homoserine lactone efflux protein
VKVLHQRRGTWARASIETRLALVAASTILLIIPGPTIMLVVLYGLGQG